MSSDVSGPVGGDVARIESLERRVSALALGFESLLYILAGDADDDIKRAAFCEALALAKTPALIADAEQALAEGRAKAVLASYEDCSRRRALPPANPADLRLGREAVLGQ
jgi:hypothetical protein